MTTKTDGRSTPDALKKKRLDGIARTTEAIVIQGVKIGKVVEVHYNDLDKLGIDERYQRAEVRPMVNQIVRALKQGGQIADHIHVAVRKDGSWWIVDGQQRWNAAILAEYNGLRAQLYHVPDIDTEKKLFVVFNSRARVHPNVIIKSWAGPGGELIRWLNGDEQSPLRGAIGFTPGNHATPATTMCRALVNTLGCGRTSGSVERYLRMLDIVVKKNPGRAQTVAKGTAILLKQFFNGHRMIASQVMPITAAAGEKWRNGPCKLPTKGDISRIQKIDWGRFGAPSLAAYAQKEVEKRWRS